MIPDSLLSLVEHAAILAAEGKKQRCPVEQTAHLYAGSDGGASAGGRRLLLRALGHPAVAAAGPHHQPHDKPAPGAPRPHLQPRSPRSHSAVE